MTAIRLGCDAPEMIPNDAAIFSRTGVVRTLRRDGVALKDALSCNGIRVSLRWRLVYGAHETLEIRLEGRVCSEQRTLSGLGARVSQRLLYASAARYQVEDQNYQSNNQQYVNQSSTNVQAETE